MIRVDRVLELVNDSGLTAKEFAENAGLAGGSITDWKTGRSKPSIESLQKIAQYANVPLEWLTGDSEFKTEKEKFNNYMINQRKILILKTIERVYDDYIPICSLKEKDIDFITKILSEVSKDNLEDTLIQLRTYVNSFDKEKKLKIKSLFNIILNELQEDLKNKNIFYNFYSSINKNYIRNHSNEFYRCPVYGQISAGEPNWAEECIEGYLPIDPNFMDIINPNECFFLRVNGESMNKEIKNGAYALIRKQDIVNDGDIAVVLVNGFDATLKKFSKQGDYILLEPMSDDRSFKVQIYDKNTPIKILGKYIGKFEINK